MQDSSKEVTQKPGRKMTPQQLMFCICTILFFFVFVSIAFIGCTKRDINLLIYGRVEPTDKDIERYHNNRPLQPEDQPHRPGVYY